MNDTHRLNQFTPAGHPRVTNSYHWTNLLLTWFVYLHVFSRRASKAILCSLHCQGVNFGSGQRVVTASRKMARLNTVHSLLLPVPVETMFVSGARVNIFAMLHLLRVRHGRSFAKTLPILNNLLETNLDVMY